jgi:hypothetical protein
MFVLFLTGWLTSQKLRISTVLGRSPAPVRKNADINIFTVASGKLYEVRSTI